MTHMQKLNNNSKLAASSVFAALTIFCLSGTGAALAATSPSLGQAATYGILSSTYTNTTAGTTVNGDVGFTTGAPVRPVGIQTNYGSGAPYSTAGTDEGSAASALASQLCTVNFAPGAINLATDTTHGPIGVYAPGVYCSVGAMNIGGPIILSGSGTYIFRPTGALTSDPGAVVTLTGASVCDVFWTPTQATTLGPNNTFFGTVIDDSGITVGANTTWTGNALAFGGTVVTDTDTITAPTTCTPVLPPPPVPVSSGGVNIIVPIIGILKVPSPLALPGGAGPVTYNYTVWNVGGLQALTAVSVADNKCAPVVLLSGDINHNNKLDPGESWKYSCTTALATTTTDTAIATGYSDDGYRQVALATAVATVVVAAPLPPPLINVVKVPSRLTPFPFGGGNVTYTYTVTNPGVAAMNNVSVTDDTCAPVSRLLGDNNGNNLLDPGETWTYTCSANVPVSTRNVATAKGSANGFTTFGYAFATVLVSAAPDPGLSMASPSAPGFPNTGLPGDGEVNIWNMAKLIGISAILLLLCAVWEKNLCHQKFH